MTKEEREVMRMALVALTIFREWELGQDYNSNRDTVLVRAFKAEEAIEKCLANDAVDCEPVAWMYQNKSTHEVRFQKYMRSFVDHSAWYEIPLYSEPLANQEKTSGSPIKEALAQPEQEPVAWYRDEDGIRIYYETKCWDDAIPLYTAPQPWEKFCDSNCVWTDHHPDCKLAQRTWVGLTDEEIQYCVELKNPEAIAEEVEAKLRSKNGY